jgi:hypothetical protein
MHEECRTSEVRAGVRLFLNRRISDIIYQYIAFMKSAILIFAVVAFLTGADRISVQIPVISFHFLSTSDFKSCNRM